jgi:D-threo-aldose 1-dehydrogenase
MTQSGQERAQFREKGGLGTSRIRLPTLGFGAAAIGNLYSPVDDATADAAINEALERGIRYFDTAPYYGYGLSEERLGRALGRAPDAGVIVSTKVGRLIELDHTGGEPRDGFAVPGRRAVFDYSRDGILRSFESSLKRLARDRVEILLLHDVGRATHGDLHDVRLREALETALPTMAALKSAGACDAIGIGVNEEAVCLEIMPRFDLDCILLAGRYTLLEQESARVVMQEAQQRDVGIIVGGPFNSGLLADARAPGSTYNYQPAREEMLERARRIYAICAEQQVDVGAAALQFVLAHPAVSSVVAGMRSPAEVASAVERARARLPSSLWQALRDSGLLLPEVPIP